VASGEVILNDWEFQTLFGITFCQLQGVASAWPVVDDSDEVTFLAINNSLNNLLGYPHGAEDKWKKYISASPAVVAQIFDRWRGSGVQNYFTGLR